MPDPSTLPQMFQESAERRGPHPALKAKLSQGGWRTITWAGYQRYVRDLAGFLLMLGVKRGDRVALLSRNSPEWAIADLAILHAGGATVPIYETLAPDKVAHILRDSGARVAVAGSRAQAEALLSHVKEAPLELVVCVEPAKGKLGKQVVDLADAYNQGLAWNAAHTGAFEERWRGAQGTDLASLIYTSGTTGEPKGVMLTHGNFVSNVLASLSVLPQVNHDDVFLSFLPLSHSFERMAGHYTPIRLGAAIAYAESIEKLPENLLELKPTVMNAVPRLFEKMWGRVEAGAKEQGKEKIFRQAVEVGKEHARITLVEKRKAPFLLGLKRNVFDKLVYSKIRARVGGNVKYFVSGGAHIREDLEWSFTGIGLPILGGYGLTETSPVISVNTQANWRPGSVGKPIPGVEVRIAEDGEIEVRGPNLMQGYYHKPDESRAVLLEDGWLKTGDIGRLDQDGFLYVTDRKKELFKTSGGKYIAPQPIEGMLRESPLVLEAVCVGDDRRFVSALVIPDFEVLVPWAKAQGVPHATREELIADPRTVQALQAEVDKVNARLSKFETIKRFRLLGKELTQEAGELTPTLKVKRRVVNQRYADLIEGMYAEGPGAPEDAAPAG